MGIISTDYLIETIYYGAIVAIAVLVLINTLKK
jgi:hypothetical protein